MTIEDWLGQENQLGMDIWTKKYCSEGEDFEAWIQRISGGNEEIGRYIKEKKFLFGGRILSNRGLNKQGRKVTYSNCYVIAPPEDEIESMAAAVVWIFQNSVPGGQRLIMQRKKPAEPCPLWSCILW